MIKHLEEYNFPNDIKELDEKELELLTYEIRDFLISTISKTGGHLASNLGIVELTLAIHKVFNCPNDKVVWDVGHQCYIHKLLTGRLDDFSTLRQEDGLSGFPKRSESPYDIFDSGHSSTSISAAMGLAEARDLNGENHSVIAVIGDGSLTGGLSFEGLNNAGTNHTNLIVILNDNEMSISESTGSLSKYLSKLRASKGYQDMKKSLKKSINGIPAVGKSLVNGLESAKGLLRYAVVNGAIFEEMGFNYYGPVDGNDINEMVEILESAKNINGPVLVHALTQKGKGYKNAEKNPGKFHGISPFDPETGEVYKTSDKPSYSKVFGDKLVEMAEYDDRIIAITAAMKDGTGLTEFAKRYEKRFYDVGIAEAHALTFASGLAIAGKKPYVNIYSTFMQRAYDQIMMDISMQNLPVTLLLDRAGNVGADGETHHGVFDLSYLRHIPNMTVMAPKNGAELEKMMEISQKMEGPCAIRFPRGDTTSYSEDDNKEYENDPIVIGKSQLIADNNVKNLMKRRPVHIWACGKMVDVCRETLDILEKEKIPAVLINARFVKPLDEAAIRNTAKSAGLIVTVEDNVIKGGFGEGVNTLVNSFLPQKTKIVNIGWPDEFVPHGDTGSMMAKYGLDAKGIAERIIKSIK